jgi:RimJ/RimL family protein N-acetyltransferase
MFTLETPRLILRDWQADDWRFVWTLASDARVTRYQTRLRLKDEDGARLWLTSAVFNNNQQPRLAYSMAVTLRDSGEVIGWLNWAESEDPSKGDVSFGYALLPALWRHGYTSEAVQAMLGFVFETQRRNSVYATCATSNPGSAGVLEKAGLTLVERWMRRDDDLDLEEEYRRYRLDRSDWLALR